ncbi:MAG: hypothetical protein LBS10_05235, partial [Gracilibacteraceae bacterium]|nr:hypothetical protein [Gracilibacteraceae bacterium]
TLAALPEPANTASISGTWRLARAQNCCVNCTSYLSTVPKNIFNRLLPEQQSDIEECARM